MPLLSPKLPGGKRTIHHPSKRGAVATDGSEETQELDDTVQLGESVLDVEDVAREEYRQAQAVEMEHHEASQKVP